jgi:hypothetical protein
MRILQIVINTFCFCLSKSREVKFCSLSTDFTDSCKLKAAFLIFHNNRIKSLIFYLLQVQRYYESNCFEHD